MTTKHISISQKGQASTQVLTKQKGQASTQEQALTWIFLKALRRRYGTWITTAFLLPATSIWLQSHNKHRHPMSKPKTTGYYISTGDNRQQEEMDPMSKPKQLIDPHQALVHLANSIFQRTGVHKRETIVPYAMFQLYESQHNKNESFSWEKEIHEQCHVPRLNKLRKPVLLT